MGDRPWLTVYNRAIVRRAAAVRIGAEPLEAMRDIEIALSYGYRPANTYYCAATIYGYASSFDASWRRQAGKYVALALEHGTPVRAFKTDPLLSVLLEELQLGRQAPRQGKARDAPDTFHFFNPLD